MFTEGWWAHDALAVREADRLRVPRRGYTIQAAEAEHVVQLGEIERAAARIFPLEVLPAVLRDQVVPIDALASAQKAGWLWVALDPQHSPVGFALARPVGETVFLAELDVHPAHGRRGLGGSLIDAVVARAQAENFTAVTLTTFGNVPWNAPFYERKGFRRLGGSEIPADLARELEEDARNGLEERVAMRLSWSICAS